MIFNFLGIFDLLIFVIIVLINIAFITLLERKILGYSQSRLGPNKPSFIGVFQPMRDAVKLFVKNLVFPTKGHSFIFWVSPIVRLILVLWVWLICPHEFDSSFFIYSTILLLIIIRLNVYPLLLRGWRSRNKYSITGSLRGVAQTISYEIRLALLILVILTYLSIVGLDLLIKIKVYFRLILIAPFLLSLWLLSRLAETNRTPFDFSEGESELVSGFNTEYRASGFAMIFMAEYGRIYFLRIITSLIFCKRSRFFILRAITTIIVFIWVWARTTFPRYRYDLLMNLAWKRILPRVLSFRLFVIRVIAL